MPSYELELRGLGGIGGFTDYGSIEASRFRVSWVLNGAGAFEAETNIASISSIIGNLTVGNREIIVRRDNVPVWGGYLSRIDVDRDDGGVKLIGEGYWAATRRRVLRSAMDFTTGTWYFSKNTAGGVIDPTNSIAWAMISAEQNQSNGSFGWVAGTHTGVAQPTYRVFSYKALDTLGPAVERMSDDGIGDFAVRVKASPTSGSVATFDTWERRGTDKSSSVQFDSSNLMTLRYSVSSEDLYTLIDVFSQYDEFVAVNKSASSVPGVSGALSSYGRRDGQSISIDSPALEDAGIAAIEFLTIHATPAHAFELSFLETASGATSWGAFDLGDTVRVSPQDGFVTYKDGRILEWDMAVEAGRTVHSLTVESPA